MATVTGKIYDQEGVPSTAVDVLIRPANEGHVIKVGGNVELGAHRWSGTSIPDPITLEAGVWTFVVSTTQRVNRELLFPPKSFTVDLTTVTTISWAEIYEGVAAFVPVTPSQVVEAQAAADAAELSATEAEAAATRAEAVGDTNDTIVKGLLDDKASATSVELSATYGTVKDITRAASPDKARVTQGLYARTRPLPDGGAPIRPMAKDPAVAGRLWAIGVGSGQLGFTDDNGTTFTTKVASLVAGQTIMQITFSNNFMWVTYSGSTDKAGSVWRSPKPDAAGNGLAFTKVFDLTGLVNGPGGAAGSGTINSALRNSSFAVAADESKAYILEYGNSNTSIALGSFGNATMAAGSDVCYVTSGTSSFFKACYVGSTFTIPGAGAAGANLVTRLQEVHSAKKAVFEDIAQTAVSGASVTINTTQFGNGVCVGGPAVYVSSNVGGTASAVTWSLGYRFDNAKHGHAIKIVNGIPWATVGDYPFPGSLSAGGSYPGATHVGVWSATTSAATAWNSRFIATQAAPYVGINFLAMNVDGVPSLVMESDGRYFHGPISLPTQSAAAGSVVPRPLCYMPGAFTETMRGLTLTSEGNLMWLGTGEGGAIGSTESVWIAAGPHYGNPVLLESVSSAGGGPYGNVGDPLESGDYIWLGTERIRKEKFLGQ